ncbi:putative cytochrome bd menaquinol oxidase subunit I [compost metagenome]
MQAEETRYKLEIPYLGSLILTHSLDRQVPALKDFPPEDRPNSTIVFWSFRIMVALGLLMIATGAWSLWLRRRERLFDCRPFLYLVLWMGPSGLIAILAGWFTTEIGRQPWVVYGLMRTANAVSDHGVTQMSVTLTLFVLVYLLVFGVGISYVLRLVRKGPRTDEGKETYDGGPGQKRTPARPLSVSAEGMEDDDGQDGLAERN